MEIFTLIAKCAILQVHKGYKPRKNYFLLNYMY